MGVITGRVGIAGSIPVSARHAITGHGDDDRRSGDIINPRPVRVVHPAFTRQPIPPLAIVLTVTPRIVDDDRGRWSDGCRPLIGWRRARLGLLKSSLLKLGFQTLDTLFQALLSGIRSRQRRRDFDDVSGRIGRSLFSYPDRGILSP
jgi:hypothetical protein